MTERKTRRVAIMPGADDRQAREPVRMTDCCWKSVKSIRIVVRPMAAPESAWYCKREAMEPAGLVWQDS